MHADADFLAAVAANPHDPLTRLVYADWLDEQGDPRGELVRIEEEVRFEPAWSDVLWRQKPRRNELRAACDPAWLQAMRYGTDCLPLFYGRPFPDHWRDGWRLIREATERWLGHPMPDVGGHADEVAAAEKRLGLTLPPSVREFVAFTRDARATGVSGIEFLAGNDTHRVLPDQGILALSSSETSIPAAIKLDDLDLDDPPASSYGKHIFQTQHQEYAYLRTPSFTRRMFWQFYDQLVMITTGIGREFGLSNWYREPLEQLRTKFARGIGGSVAFDGSELFETINLTVGFIKTEDPAEPRINVKVFRPLRREEVPGVLWEYVRGRLTNAGTALEDYLVGPVG